LRPPLRPRPKLPRPPLPWPLRELVGQPLPRLPFSAKLTEEWAPTNDANPYPVQSAPSASHNRQSLLLCPVFATRDGFGPSSTWCLGWWMRSIWWLIYTSIKSYFMTTVFFNCSVPHPYIIYCWSMLHHALLPCIYQHPHHRIRHTHLPTHLVTINPTLDVSSHTIPKMASSTSTNHNGQPLWLGLVLLRGGRRGPSTPIP
jgi:hypothetical protein